MRNSAYDSRTADKFVVRMPGDMRDEVAVEAGLDNRSMNGVFIKAMREYLDRQAEDRQAQNDQKAGSMHIDDRVRMIAADPLFMTVVFKLPTLDDAQPLIQQLPYGQKVLGTEAVTYGLTAGAWMEGHL